MIANYHTHTWRCNHAQGTERETVEKAIQGGLKILGFSDHTPYLFDGNHYSSFRMRPELLEDYVRTVIALRDEYRDDIEIHLGLEVEYYPRLFERLLKLTGDFPIEYFLLGQHFTDNETDGQYSGIPTKDETVLARYCEQSLEALGTGKYLYFAHPDLLHFIGDPQVYDRHVRALCRGVKALGLPLEINFLGLYEGRHYPNPEFWRIAGEEGCEAVLGCDAHSPEAVCRPETEEKARALASQYGLRVRETMPLFFSGS